MPYAMTAPDAASVPALRSGNYVLTGLVCAGVLGIDLSQVAVGNALSPVFTAAPYRLDPHALAWVLSAVYVGAVIGAPCLGKLADRWGLKRTICLALAWLGIVSWVTGLDPAIAHLPALRFLAGLSLGALPPLVISYLTGLSPPRHRTRTILWVSALSFLAGPATIFGVRAALPTHPFGIDGWRWPFLVAGTLAVVFTLVFQSLPEAPTRERSEPGEAADSRAESAWSGLGKRFGFLASVYFLHPWVAVGFSLSLGPALLHRGYNLSNTLFFVGMNLFGPSITTFFAGTVADRIDRRVGLAAACGVMLASSVLFFVSAAPLLVLLAVTLFGIADGFYLPLMTAYGAEIFPARVRGSATSGAWSLNRVAAFCAPMLLLPLLHARGEWAVTLIICAALAASASLLLWAGPPARRRAA